MFWTLYKFVLSLYPMLKSDMSQGDQLLTTLTHLEVYLPAVSERQSGRLVETLTVVTEGTNRHFFLLIFIEQLKK